MLNVQKYSYVGDKSVISLLRVEDIYLRLWIKINPFRD